MSYQIGEIKQSRDIWGGTNRHNFMWCKCPVCGKERWVIIVKGEPKSKHCNACAIRKPRRGQIIKCANCGKENYLCQSSLKSKNYCSRQCRNEAQIKGRQNLICQVCGKEYFRFPSQIKWRGSSCCSYKCAAIHQRTAQKGELSHSWKGGVSAVSKRIRASAEYTEWRQAVFEKDNYTCQDCGVRSGNGKAVFLHPHHIKSFKHYPELRFEISNGITMCEDCHKRHTAWQHLGGL